VAVDVLTEIVVNRPVDEVAAYAQDPGNAPEWYVNIDSVDWRTPPPLGVGSRLAFVARFLGRRLAYTYEVAELVPGRTLVMRTSEGPFPMETTYTWEPAGAGATRMTLRNRGRPSGFARVAAPLMAAAMRRANRSDLRSLKTLLEARSRAPTPAGEESRWQVTCPCGWRTRGTRDEVVAAVQEHGRTAHGVELTDDQVMAQAVRLDGP
jgi:hypothetical protein